MTEQEIADIALKMGSSPKIARMVATEYTAVQPKFKIAEDINHSPENELTFQQVLWVHTHSEALTRAIGA